MTPEALQKYRNLSKKITTSYVTKLNTQMLAETAVVLHYMAKNVDGLIIPRPVFDKLKSRLQIVKPTDHVPFDVLIDEAWNLMVNSQNRLTTRFMRYVWFGRQYKDALETQRVVRADYDEGFEEARIFSLTTTDAHKLIMANYKQYYPFYEVLKNKIGDVALIFKQDAQREALVSMGMNWTYELVDHLEPRAPGWAEAELRNKDGKSLVVTSVSHASSISFDNKIPTIRFTPHSRIIKQEPLGPAA